MTAPDFSERIAGLKDQVLHAQDLFKAMQYFLDHLAENEHFRSSEVCEPAKLDRLETVLHATATIFLKRKRARTHNVLMLRARGTPMYHGGFFMEGCLFTFVYFDDISKGLMGCVVPGDPTTHMLRITCQPDDSASSNN